GDELVAFGGTEAERIAVTLEREKELGAVAVFPLAGVHSTAPQSHDDREMLDAHGTLVFAGSASGALERGFLGEMFAEQRFLRGGAEVVQIVAHAQSDFLGIEDLAGVVRGAMFGATAALHT